MVAITLFDPYDYLRSFLTWLQKLRSGRGRWYTDSEVPPWCLVFFIQKRSGGVFFCCACYIHVTRHVFCSSHFSFLVLVTYDDQVMKIQKYYVIFVYILQGKTSKTGKKTERKSYNLSDQKQKTQMTKIWDERNISKDNSVWGYWFASTTIEHVKWNEIRVSFLVQNTVCILKLISTKVGSK